MAGQSSSLFKIRFLLAPTVLFLFTPPIFSILTFFWPLIVSTVLGVLAVLSFGGRRVGTLTEQEEDISENSTPNTDVDVSSVAHVQEISDVLMVGNHEVGWLEWLHNEDMEKCHAADRARFMHTEWVSDQYEFETEPFVDNLSSQAKRKCVVDAYDSMVKEEESVNEVVQDDLSFSCMTTLEDDISVRTQFDNMTSVVALASSVSDLSEANASSSIHEDVNAMKKNVQPPLNAEDMAKQYTITDDLLNVMLKQANVLPVECTVVMKAITMEAVTLKDVDSDSTEASRTCGYDGELEITGGKIENMIEPNDLAFSVHNDSESGFADGLDVRTSATGMASTVHDESLVGALALELRDGITRQGITKFQYGLKAAEEPKASEHIRVERDEGEYLVPSLTSKVVNMAGVLEFPSPKIGISLTQEQEVSTGGQETERHTHQDDSQEKDTRENNGDPIQDMSDDEENKSSLRFSFFHNGCLTLTQLKQEAGDLAPPR